MNKKKILGIILAKSKSRRIKNKNFIKIKGKYMFQYVLDESIKSQLFKKIHISTETNFSLNKIKNLKKNKTYKKYLDTSFLRPKKMASDKYPMEKVVRFIKKKFDKFNYTDFAMIYSTAINLKKKDLTYFIKYYSNLCKKYPRHGISCQILTAFPAPVEWSMRLKKNGEIVYDSIKSHKKTSDTFTKKYFDAGGVQIFNKLYFSTNKIKKFGVVMPYYKCIDIDFKDDFELAKKLI